MCIYIMYMATDKDNCVFLFSFIRVANEVMIKFMTVIPLNNSAWHVCSYSGSNTCNGGKSDLELKPVTTERKHI